MSIAQLFKASCGRNSGKAAIGWRDQSLTFAEFDRLTDNIAQNLLAGDVQPGDRLALHLPNGPEVALGVIGCLKAGCVVVPVNTRLKGREIDYVLRHSESVCYLGEPELYGEIAESCSAIEEVGRRYLVGGSADGSFGAFEDLLRSPDRSISLPAMTADAIAAVLYTSGTTAQPRGVIHTHKSLEAAVETMRTTGLEESEVVLIMSSISHMIGLGMLLLPSLLIGATTVITRPFDFGGCLDAIAHWRCTYTGGLPVIFQGLLQEQMRAPRDVSSGKCYFCGGDAVTPALQDAFQRVFAPVREGYGMTEITPIALNRPDNIRVGSLGQAMDGVEIRLVDSTGREVEALAEGEVLVRGPHLMRGYWRNTEATAAVFQDGWLRTGDLARRDADGFYWFAGRSKEIIIRGGSNISPQEVEAVLCEHAAVAEAGVVGRPHPVWGEVVVAHVAVRPGQQLDEAELISFARERLAEYKTPETVIVHEELPKGPTGKIQRRALREALAAGA
ncbi:MAG TPA: AMP-binding protein [Bryobacteraceae bacterium]|nr:AMP-binding protein [Bryobacteraceae bacterium]